jgi:hypothetical protein
MAVIIPALGRPRQDDHEFEASLGYIENLSQLKLHRETLSQKQRSLYL